MLEQAVPIGSHGSDSSVDTCGNEDVPLCAVPLGELFAVACSLVVRTRSMHDQIEGRGRRIWSPMSPFRGGWWASETTTYTILRVLAGDRPYRPCRPPTWGVGVLSFEMPGKTSRCSQGPLRASSAPRWLSDTPVRTHHRGYKLPFETCQDRYLGSGFSFANSGKFEAAQTTVQMVERAPTGDDWAARRHHLGGPPANHVPRCRNAQA